jgi:AmmeMemoRadiSam system protein B
MSSASQTRPAAVAGSFYPASAHALDRMVDGFLSEAKPSSRSDPKAVIAPHAGFIYSGPIAGSAFRPWANAAESIRRVILIGPSHYVYFDGLALPSAAKFSTPFGDVALDLDAVKQLQTLPQVQVFDPAHEQEHCLEVELPFLQRMLKDFQIVPLVVGEAGDDEIREVIDRLWGGPETRIVISSDLSHYHGYDAARRLDRTTADNIKAQLPDKLTGNHACGYRPIRGFLRAVEARGLCAETTDLRNSGDTAGPRDRVVGYGAFLFGAKP